MEQLTERFGWEAPAVWSVRIDADQAPALLHALASPAGGSVPLGDLLLDPHDRSWELECRALYLARANDSTVMLPHRRTPVQPGDRLLLVGRGAAQSALDLTLHNENTCDYVLWGREIPGGWVWEQLARLHAR